MSLEERNAIMTNKEYVEAIDRIAPKDNVKEELRQSIFNTTQSKQHKPTFRWGLVAAAALAIICVGTLSVPAVASGIRSFILNRFPSYSQITDAIDNAVYSQSDEHILMSVDELLSDGIVANMTVRYTALDKDGEEWLANFTPHQNSGPNHLSLKPYMPNTIEYGTNFSYGMQELTEQATKTERLFLLEFVAASRDYYADTAVFTFPMTDGQQKEKLDVTGNLPIRSYTLHAEEAASEYYTPTYIEISPMSYVIYAKNHGVFERAADGESYWERWLLPDEELQSLKKESYFIMKDGSHEPLHYGWHSTTHANADNMYSDVMLYSNQFLDGTEIIPTTPKLMDIDEIEAVVINGVRFEFGE